MDKLITLWQNMTTEQLVITLLIVSVVLLFRMVVMLSGKYNQLDKLLLLVCDRSHRDMVKIHRNGDYEIVQPLNDD